MTGDNRGAERRTRAQGKKADRLQAALTELDPMLGRLADEHIFGDVWASEKLAFRDRMLVAITALAALGRRNQLRNYLHGALQDGWTPDELREVMRMLTVYAGFPTAIEAMVELDAAVQVFEKRS